MKGKKRARHCAPASNPINTNRFHPRAWSSQLLYSRPLESLLQGIADAGGGRARAEL